MKTKLSCLLFLASALCSSAQTTNVLSTFWMTSSTAITYSTITNKNNVFEQKVETIIRSQLVVEEVIDQGKTNKGQRTIGTDTNAIYYVKTTDGWKPFKELRRIH